MSQTTRLFLIGLAISVLGGIGWCLWSGASGSSPQQANAQPNSTADAAAGSADLAAKWVGMWVAVEPAGESLEIARGKLGNLILEFINADGQIRQTALAFPEENELRAVEHDPSRLGSTVSAASLRTYWIRLLGGQLVIRDLRDKYAEESAEKNGLDGRKIPTWTYSRR